MRHMCCRYKKPADWALISKVVQSTDVPIIGNGDILTFYEVRSVSEQQTAGLDDDSSP